MEKEDEKQRTSKPYRELVGCLTYAALTTRPDLAAAVNYFSQFQSCPTEEHWVHLKRILRYIKGTLDVGLVYKESPPMLEVYSDADWAQGCKGCKRSVLIEEGQIVIVKDDNLPPTKWPLGRITKVHPGKDGAVRVVTLKTASSEGVVRPVARIAILPLPNDPEFINNDSKDPEQPVGTTGSD